MSPKGEKTPRPLEKMSFEECFEEIEKLVELFEQGELPLTEAINLFERGMNLISKCSGELSAAEKKVAELLTKISPDGSEPSGSGILENSR